MRKGREEGAGEEAVRARARRAETVPSEKEVEVYNLDHGVFRSWRPYRVKGRAEAHGRVRKVIGESDLPTAGVDYMCMHSEQEEEEEKGMPFVVVKGDKTKTIVAKAAPSNGVENYAVEVAKRMVEC